MCGRVRTASRFGGWSPRSCIAFRPDLLHVEVHDGGTPQELDREGTRPASVAGRSLELFDALALAWASSPEPDRPGHVVWFELEA